MQCVQCCARLLRSARPLRRAQDALLAAILCHPDAPSRVEIMDALKQHDLDMALAQIEPVPTLETVPDTDHGADAPCRPAEYEAPPQMQLVMA